MTTKTAILVGGPAAGQVVCMHEGLDHYRVLIKSELGVKPEDDQSTVSFDAVEYYQMDVVDANRDRYHLMVAPGVEAPIKQLIDAYVKLVDTNQDSQPFKP